MSGSYLSGQPSFNFPSRGKPGMNSASPLMSHQVRWLSVRVASMAVTACWRSIGVHGPAVFGDWWRIGFLVEVVIEQRG